MSRLENLNSSLPSCRKGVQPCISSIQFDFCLLVETCVGRSHSVKVFFNESLLSESIKLPNFWYHNVTAYFHTVELLFDHASILDEVSRYPKLIHALTKYIDVMKTLASVLQSLSREHPYTDLKNHLLRQYARRQITSIPVMLQTCNRRSESVTD